ncbi:unnamed protein product [Amoebophrya sp. A120]|nr:unnamed protein product [Amoebophrya sp. A120]|eukprot:GSA120T00002572001.1
MSADDNLWGAWLDVRDRDIVKENADAAFGRPRSAPSTKTAATLARPSSAAAWLQRRQSELQRRRDVAEYTASPGGSPLLGAEYNYTSGGSSSSTNPNPQLAGSSATTDGQQVAAPRVQSATARPPHGHSSHRTTGASTANGADEENVLTAQPRPKTAIGIPSRFKVNTHLIDFSRKGLSPSFRTGTGVGAGGATANKIGNGTGPSRGDEDNTPLGGARVLASRTSDLAAADATTAKPAMSPIVEESSILTAGEENFLEKKRIMCEKSPKKSIFSMLNIEPAAAQPEVVEKPSSSPGNKQSMPRTPSRLPSSPSSSPLAIARQGSTATLEVAAGESGDADSAQRTAGPPRSASASPSKQKSGVESPQQIMERLQKRWRAYLEGIAAEEEARQRKENWKRRMAEVESNRMSAHDRQKFFNEIRYKAQQDSHFHGQFILAQATEMLHQNAEQPLDAALRYRLQTLLEKAAQVTHGDNVSALLLLAALEEEEKNYTKARQLHATIVQKAKEGNEIALTCLVEVAEFRERQIQRDADNRRKRARKKSMMKVVPKKKSTNRGTANVIAELAMKREEVEQPILKYTVQQGFLEPMRKALLRLTAQHPSDKRHLDSLKRKIAQEKAKENREHAQSLATLKKISGGFFMQGAAKTDNSEVSHMEKMRLKLLQSTKLAVDVNTMMQSTSSDEEKRRRGARKKPLVSEDTVVQWIPREYYQNEKVAYRRQIDRGYDEKFDQEVTLNHAGVITFHTRMARANFGQQRRPQKKKSRGQSLLKKASTQMLATGALVEDTAANVRDGLDSPKEPPEAGRLHVERPQSTLMKRRPDSAPYLRTLHTWDSSKGFDVFSMMHGKSEDYNHAVRSAATLVSRRHKRAAKQSASVSPDGRNSETSSPTLSRSPSVSPKRSEKEEPGAAAPKVVGSSSTSKESNAMTPTVRRVYSVKENSFRSLSASPSKQQKDKKGEHHHATGRSLLESSLKLAKLPPKLDPDEIDTYPDLDVAKLFPIETKVQNHDPRRVRRSYGLVPTETPDPPEDDFALRARPPERASPEHCFRTAAQS